MTEHAALQVLRPPPRPLTDRHMGPGHNMHWRLRIYLLAYCFLGQTGQLRVANYTTEQGQYC
jgi:hypothetical protein